MIEATETPSAPATGTSELNSLDRCDSCGAQAYVRVGLPTGELLFCAHHGRKYQETLSQVATSWHDESSKLTEAPAADRD